MKSVKSKIIKNELNVASMSAMGFGGVEGPQSLLSSQSVERLEAEL